MLFVYNCDDDLKSNKPLGHTVQQALIIIIIINIHVFWLMMMRFNRREREKKEIERKDEKKR